jgi:hypothetical protein
MEQHHEEKSTYIVSCNMYQIYLHDVKIIPWTFVGPETSSLTSTSACSTQKFRKLAADRKIKCSIKGTTEKLYDK